MARFPVLPFWVDAYLADTIHLSTKEHGAYLLLLMTAWRMPDCSLPDDDRMLAKFARMDGRGWRFMRPVMEQFFDINNGRWRQIRLTKERKNVVERSDKMKENAQARWLKNKETANANAKQTPCKQDATISISKSISSKKESVSIEEAISAYNELADEIGLPKAQRFTESRRTALRLRLEECGGLEGWAVALAKIRGSPFLRGENDRGWRASLDFMLRQSSFTKIMEGAYDRPATPDPTEAIRRGILAGMGDELGAVGSGTEGGDGGSGERGNGKGAGDVDTVPTEGAGGVSGKAVPHVGGLRGEGGRDGVDGDLPGHVGADAGGLAGRGG